MVLLVMPFKKKVAVIFDRIIKELKKSWKKKVTKLLKTSEKTTTSIVYKKV